MYFGSQYDASCQDVRIGPNNTFSLNTVHGLNKGTFALVGYKGIGNNNLYILDPQYAGEAADLDINHWWDMGQTGSYGQVDYNVTDTYEVVFEHTCSLFVKGNNELPVISAACSLWNNQGALIISGVTNANGVLSGYSQLYIIMLVIGPTPPSTTSPSMLRRPGIGQRVRILFRGQRPGERIHCYSSTPLAMARGRVSREKKIRTSQ